MKGVEFPREAFGRTVMNLADLYAIGCLLGWGGLAGYIVWIFCRKPPREQNSGETFPVGTALLAVLLSYILYRILLIGNPGYLAVALFLWTLILCAVGSIRGQFRLLRYGLEIAIIGTLGLYLLFDIVCANGFVPADNFIRIKRIQTLSAFRLATEDKTLYPAGILDENHPAAIAHPELLKWWTCCGTPRRLWHSGFTNFFEGTSLPPFEFAAGTIAENLEAIEQHIFSSGQTVSSPDAKSGGRSVLPPK